jgi:hypothetical protein
MDTAEIVVGEVQAVRGPEVLPLLRERVRQPREAAHVHPDREVLALHMAGANFRRVGVAHDWDLLRVRYVGGTVPVLAFGIVHVNFDELCEVAAVAQCGRNRADVGLESIGADLEALATGRVAQAFDKGVRAGLAAPAQSEVQHQLGVPFDGDEAVGVADAVIVRFKRCLVAFLFLDKSPDLIALNILDGDIDDEAAHNLLAFLAGLHQDPHDGVDVQVGDALCAPQAIAFDQEPECQHDALLGDVGAFQRGLVVLSVGLVALGATEAAQAIPMDSEALTPHVAFGASHCGYGRCQHLNTSDNTASNSCLSTLNRLYLWLEPPMLTFSGAYVMIIFVFGRFCNTQLVP